MRFDFMNLKINTLVYYKHTLLSTERKMMYYSIPVSAELTSAFRLPSSFYNFCLCLCLFVTLRNSLLRIALLPFVYSNLTFMNFGTKLNLLQIKKETYI